MKFLKFTFLLLFILVVGVFAYLAFNTPPFEQNEVVKEIPSERFVNE